MLTVLTLIYLAFLVACAAAGMFILWEKRKAKAEPPLTHPPKLTARAARRYAEILVEIGADKRHVWAAERQARQLEEQEAAQR